MVVDFDMHKPKVHKELELDNQIGNSTNLSAKTNFDKSKVELEKDLFVITSGPVPPNPSELVLSNQVKKLFSYAQKNYDYFFIDTPPIGYITDALVLSSLVDHSIFVMNTKFANKKGLTFLEDIIERSNINSNAIILNGVKKQI